MSCIAQYRLNDSARYHMNHPEPIPRDLSLYPWAETQSFPHYGSISRGLLLNYIYIYIII